MTANQQSCEKAFLPPVMKIGVVTGAGHTETQSLPVPVPAADEILVRVQGCGICGSNLPVWEGRPWFSYPLPPGAPGHEAWGIVVRLGSGVSRFSLGDRVAYLSDRGFAEFESVSESRMLLLPEQLADSCFPGEALACAVNILERSAIRAGQNVAIVGVGFLGALLTSLAKLAGAHVAAISRRPFAREVAQRFGADVTCDWDGRSAQHALRLTSGEGFDCVIEAVGTQEALNSATELTRVRGKLVIAGYHQDGRRNIDLQLWNWRGLDVINAHERDPEVYLSGMQRAIQLIVNGSLDPAPLYTHQFSLDRLSEAFEMLRTRPNGFMKALVLPGANGAAAYATDTRKEAAGVLQ